MHDKDLKYIAISYRWGEVDEQLVETPDYTAHITSFHIFDLMQLCGYIKRDADIKKIPYLWIDAISVDQQNHSRKKETILQMSKIYKRASYILAVPDLPLEYLRTNPENKDVIHLIQKYKYTIVYDISKMIYQTDDDNDNKYDDGVKNGDKMKIYRFLAYLVQDWANRAWVISEYQIAKEKYQVAKEKKEPVIPMKYTFMSLIFHTGYDNKWCSLFFSYSFDHQGININNNNHNNDTIHYIQVDNGRKFIKFLKRILTQRPYLDMLLNSKASRNEDRFNAILPSWEKYRHVIKDKNTISSWQITNMVSVRLKLYEIMDDLWDKARLLHACSRHISPGFPTFASKHHNKHVYLKELDGIDTRFYYSLNGEYYLFKKQKNFINGVSLNNASDNEIDHSTKYALNSYYVPYEILNEQMQIGRASKIKQFTNNVMSNNIINAKIGDANLIDIQLNDHGKYGHPYLSVKSKFCYYCTFDKEVSDRLKSEYSLKDADCLICVRIPFFIPGKTEFEGYPSDISDVHLVGDENKNIWVVHDTRYRIGCKDWTFVFTVGYTFNVY